MDDIDLRNWNRSFNRGVQPARTITPTLPPTDKTVPWPSPSSNATSGGGALATHAFAQRFSPKRMGQVAKAAAVRAKLEAERGVVDELPAVESANRAPGRNIVNTVVIHLRRLQAREREAIESVRRRKIPKALREKRGPTHELWRPEVHVPHLYPFVQLDAPRIDRLDWFMENKGGVE